MHPVDPRATEHSLWEFIRLATFDQKHEVAHDRAAGAADHAQDDPSRERRRHVTGAFKQVVCLPERTLELVSDERWHRLADSLAHDEVGLHHGRDQLDARRFILGVASQEA